MFPPSTLPEAVRRRTAALVVVLLTGAMILPSGAVGEQPSNSSGEQLSGRVVSLTAVDRGPDKAKTNHRPRSAERLVPDRAALASAKDRAAARTSPGRSLPDEPEVTEPRAALYAGLNQPGIPAGGYSPPDTTGAIGPNDYIETVNGTVRIYDRNLTTVQASASLGSFIGYPSDSVGDPQIQWDQQAQRFLFVMYDTVGFAANYVAFGWSKTADPGNLTSDWCIGFVNTGYLFDDYPKLGHNDTHLLIGANVFDDYTTLFVGARLWEVPKPANGNTECGTGSVGYWWLTTSDGDDAFTPVPANTFGTSANGYVVASDFMTGDSEIMMWHVSGPIDSPVLTKDGEITVSPYEIPANVPQPGTPYVLDSSDSRLTQAVATADPAAGGALAIWTQHTIDGVDGRSVVRWYELVPGAATPLRQEGTISSPDHFVFNGAISPSASGSDAVINYNVGSATLAAEIRAQARSASTVLGQMEGEITLGTSATFDQDLTCVLLSTLVCRWGDYAGASPDPINTSVVWGSNQANGTPNANYAHWVTRNFALSPSLVLAVPDPPTGASAISGNSQATVYWAAPSSDGGSPITAYTATSSPGNLTCATGGLSCTVGGLANGTPYTFTVTATNAVGTGPGSAPSNSVTPATSPDAPASVVAAPGDAQALVSWSAPVADGGSPIIDYTVTSTPDAKQCTTTGLSCFINGLSNGTRYVFTVTARNDAGPSPESTPSNSVTPGPTVSVSDASVQEGSRKRTTRKLIFTVTLSQPLNRKMTVRYATANGTASAGSDYIAKSVKLTIKKGRTSATIVILVKGDRLFEPDETLYINLSNAIGAAIWDGQGLGTIINDD